MVLLSFPFFLPESLTLFARPLHQACMCVTAKDHQQRLTFSTTSEITVASSADHVAPAKLFFVLAFFSIYSSLHRKLLSEHSELFRRGPIVEPTITTKESGKFDSKRFLSTIDGGRKIVVFRKKQTIVSVRPTHLFEWRGLC